MPKEVTHWIIAEETLKELAPDNEYRLCALKHHDLFFLGAVFPDALYYYTGKNKEFLKLPGGLHGGKKEDTFEIIHALIQKKETAPGARKELLAALIAGILTHIFVDTNFHPFIYYYTGNYFNPDPEKRKIAIKRHRNFESLLDLHFDREAATSPKYKLGKICSTGLGKLKEVFEGGLKIQSFAGEILFPDLKLCFNNYKLGRRIYTGKNLSAFQALDRMLPGNLAEVLSLSYYNIKLKNPIDFHESFTFYHPVTGKKITQTIEKARKNAAKQCAGALLKLTSGKLNETGPSLETGLPLCDLDEMKHFYEYPAEKR